VLSGLHDAGGLAVAKDGTIFVTEETGNRVLRFDAGSRKRTVIAADGIDQPLGLMLASDGSVLVADSRHHRIVRIRQDGTVETALDGLGLPIGLAAAPDGTVLVADHVDHLLRGNILRLHADGTTDTVSGGKIRGLSGVAVARNGTLYATSFYAPFVGKLTASGALKAFPTPR
jgi:glucose/arabinose dehydrogenase